MTTTRILLALAVATTGMSAASSAWAGDDENCCQSSTTGESMLVMAQEQAAPADEMLAAYRGVQLPPFDQARQKDQAYVQEYIKLRSEALKQKVELGRKFVLAHPSHPEAAKVASEFVQTEMFSLGKAAEARADIKTILAIEGIPQDLVATLEILDASALLAAERDADAAWERAEELNTKYPGDERIARLMSQVAQASQGPQQIDRYKQTLAAFPDSRATKYAKGKIRAAEGVGKPFEISFTDAVTGESVTSEDLKGKVVVVDFWATWCGPCVAEMPKMKQLYATYKDKGVQFVGISLDNPEAQGGKQALLAYCKENDITWPQYYQGNGWESEFSTSWGINSIPAVFVIDAEGNLYTTEARGKLEQLIPELLGKRDGMAGGRASR